MTIKPKSKGKARGRKAAPNDFVERALYDGTRLLGSYRPAKNGFAAYDRKGKRLGTFNDERAARAAIAGDREP
jgi:hypothetical protein